ncbi:nuclear protein DGCR14 [Cristinia sonorae]|uniref:Nuclear protein DGCR14 n=1 Tax=Cristinia sonorae TaxID=1940300 RepID=A0A8K0XRI6_9AGAR|nr:nuclear protein DGCR14 [Cristinia sonorae]
MATPTPSSSTETETTRSLNRQVVLDEDEYTEALSHIIARDFFPSLVHLDATNEYLDALQTKDQQLIHASVRRLEQLSTPATHRSRQTWRTPSRTPYAAGPSDTPLRTPHSDMPPPSKRPRYDTDMSLDTFQARYTSEDNSSFTQILDEENRVRKEKWSWAWEAQDRAERQRGKMLEQRERLLIEAPAVTGVREKFMIEPPAQRQLITAGGEAGEEEKEKEGEEEEEGKATALVIKPPTLEEEVVDIMAPKKDVRSAGVDGWKFKARNSLMFPPDADQTPYSSAPTQTTADPKAVPKVIKYGNTRLPEQDDTHSHSPAEPPSPTRSRIDAAIAGTPYRPRSPGGDRFSLVPAVPSPTPSQLGPAAVQQLMTWGSLTATPRILSQSDDPAEASMPPPHTPFRISEPSSREQLSHKLSAKASKSLRAKAMLLGGSAMRTPASVRGSGSSGRNGSMPPPSWTPKRAEAAGGLTPAARRLLDRTTMGTAAVRRAQAMRQTAGWEGSSSKDRDLNRVRWTPTPSPVSRRDG